MTEQPQKPLALNKARRAMVLRHMEYAAKIASQFHSRGLATEEALSDAYYGLCIAALHFDRRARASFETFAYYHIRKAMSDSMRRRWHHQRGVAEMDGYRDVIDERPGESQHREEQHEAVTEMLRSLNPRERDVVCKLYGIGCVRQTAQQVAQKLRISNQKLYDIHDRALNKLATHPKAADFRQLI